MNDKIEVETMIAIQTKETADPRGQLGGPLTWRITRDDR